MPSFNSVTEWTDWQQQLHTSSIDLGLERIRVIARRMRLLSPKFRIVTIAGTNGKGSCACMLEAMLLPHERVGVYTSPHFLRYNERIRIDGVEVSDEQLCEAFERVERARHDISLSFFEFGTLAALWLFVEHKVDCAVLEVGLGGRMDAVNLWDADVALITSIGIDHTEWLGRTRESIGREKAGIMRPGKPVVCGEEQPPISLLDQAERLNALLQRIGRDYAVEVLSSKHWRYRHRDGLVLELPMPSQLPGRVQLNNAASVLSVLRLLDRLDVDVVREALENISLVGRFQVLDSSVDTVLDIAHNPDSATNLARNLRRHRADRPLHAVFSALREKDVASIFTTLSPMFDSWSICEVQSPRAMPLETLKVLADTWGLRQAHTYSSLQHAYQAAIDRAGDDGTVVVFGSFFIVGEFLLNQQALISTSSS